MENSKMTHELQCALKSRDNLLFRGIAEVMIRVELNQR